MRRQWNKMETENEKGEKRAKGKGGLDWGKEGDRGIKKKTTNNI